MEKIKDILKFAMKMEKDAENFYNYYMDRVESESIKNMFSELSKMEREHYEILKDKFEQLEFKEPPLTISWVVDDDSRVVDPSIIHFNSDLIGEDEKEMSDLTIIRMAYHMENDFVMFYKNAAAEAEDAEAKKFLEEIVKWEESHRDIFQKKYEELTKKHWKNITNIIFK
ncbi:MAG TPA: ferritin family protein [Acetivibrio saccincola]|uniref:ferritin family protein n=1 Tax=Acetivibrio saccincola TaxID=1677857 RepID=UPI002B64CBA8|nr:ferritin family protein [Acetivibrio saccincola]HOA98161.1 ferritin family protein [Acetivibrio saccincola]HQD28175.1 ferritin family protein [Acetivibrio saccincola]